MLFYSSELAAEKTNRPTDRHIDRQSLWSNPWGVATFLKSLPPFDFLPDIETPPPRRRRRLRPPPDPPPPPPPQLPPLTPPVFSPLDLAHSSVFTPGIRPLMSLSPLSRYSSVSYAPLYSSISSNPLSPSSPRLNRSHARRNASYCRGHSEDLFESDVG